MNDDPTCRVCGRQGCEHVARYFRDLLNDVDRLAAEHEAGEHAGMGHDGECPACVRELDGELADALDVLGDVDRCEECGVELNMHGGHPVDDDDDDRPTLESCTCGECRDCPDGWHHGDEMPCSCTADCALSEDDDDGQ